VLQDKFKLYPEIYSLLGMLEVREEPHTKFWDIVTRTDRIRSLNFPTLCPEWSALL